jgi:hypothetical protein
MTFNSVLQKFSLVYPSHKQAYHPLSHLYWVRPVVVVWAKSGVVQYVHKEPFKATAATLMLIGLVQAAQGVHITQDHELQQLGPGREPGTVEKLWRAFRAFRTLGLSKGQSDSQIEKKWASRFSEAFRPHFSTYHRPQATHFYAPSVGAGAIGGTKSATQT